MKLDFRQVDRNVCRTINHKFSKQILKISFRKNAYKRFSKLFLIINVYFFGKNTIQITSFSKKKLEY